MPVTPTDRRRTMTTRSNPYKAAPELMKAWFALSQQVEKAGIEPDLLELVKIRSSQINGCANCLNMHHAQARKLGEQQKRQIGRAHVCTPVTNAQLVCGLR